MLLGVVLFTPCLSFAAPQTIACGDTLPWGYFRLSNDVVCADGDTSSSPAITLTRGTVLDLNGHTINCNQQIRDGILIEGTGNILFHGSVSGCTHGVHIRSNHNYIVGVTAHDNRQRGFFVDDSDNNHFVKCVAEANGQQGFDVRVPGENGTGAVNNLFVNCVAVGNGRQGFNVEGPEGDVPGPDNNLFVNCVARENGRHGFKILLGDGNHIRHSDALANCRDGIEVEAGDDNTIINNRAEDNGNEATCATFGEAYRPWFYAGIDLLAGSEDNKVISNRTSGNTGCTAQSAAGPCEGPLRDRNLWDENVDAVTGECISTNRWHNNREDGHQIDPECAPGPQ
jgi:parallel beta-helix repeat protein